MRSTSPQLVARWGSNMLSHPLDIVPLETIVKRLSRIVPVDATWSCEVPE